MIDLFGDVLEGELSAWVGDDWYWEKEKREETKKK